MNITILGFTFPITQRYDAGHVCSESEAQALQRYFNRHLAKGIHKAIADMVGVDSNSEIQSRGEQFSSQFAIGFTQGHERIRAINAEARSMALQAIETRMYKRGQNVKSLTQFELEDMVTKLSAQEGIQKIAEERVDYIQRIARSAHDDLTNSPSTNSEISQEDEE
jgi:hypothetical protein